MGRLLEDLLKLVALAFAIVVMAGIGSVVGPGSAAGMIDWTAGLLAVMFVVEGVRAVVDLLVWVTE